MTGRPPLPDDKRKKLITLRLAPELVDAMRYPGKGWQRYVESALRQFFMGPKLEEKEGIAVEVEKGPGYDWAVTYRWEDGTTGTMSVFGVVSIDKAIQEARWSLEPLRLPGGGFTHDMLFDIIGAWRMDVKP